MNGLITNRCKSCQTFYQSTMPKEHLTGNIKRMLACTHFLLIFLIVSLVTAQTRTHSLDLALPTDNDAIFHGGGADFYQVVQRDFQGVQTTPWEGGQYGFVRDPVETPAGIICKRFHEGIDIRPVHRDARGEPLDEVRAIADGTVVHINLIPGLSNYGKYLVLEHRWEGSSYYSLYAHLASTAVQPEQKVQRGDRLGIMGHTGEGLDKARAHLHLELNLMLSRNFEDWYHDHIRNDPNRHGLYNGINLVGLNIGQFYLALRDNPSLTIPQFLAHEVTFYKVTLPRSDTFDLPKLYSWLLTSGAQVGAKSWEVSFAQSGLPLRIEPGSQSVSEPTLTYFKRSPVNYSYLTRDVLGGRGEHAYLTENGKHLMRLLIYPD
jgi:murein DD-endopeptidase MepM/ murein hydrolase activator NlpD